MTQSATMTIPEIRDEFTRIAYHMRAVKMPLMASRIEKLVEQMHRRHYVRKARAKSVPMTPKVAAAIRQYARDNPKANYMEIAAVFKVSSGRVSEALAGKRPSKR